MKLQDNRQSTSCAAEALVRTFQSPDSSVDSTVIEAACLSNKCVLPANSEQNLSFGKMFQESYPQIKVEILNASYVPSQVGDKSISKKWANAGFFCARRETEYSVCYRIFDTRFFGIPQRRRRIFLIASLGNNPRPEILFESDGVRRNSTTSRETRQSFTAFANQGIGKYNQSRNAATLRLGGDIKGGGGTLIAGTLDTSYAKQYGCDNQHVDAGCPNFVIYENNGQDSRIKETGEIAPTLSAKMGTGGNNTPLCIGFSHKDNGRDAYYNVSPTLRSMCGNDGNNSGGGSAAVCIAENIIGRKVENGGNGVGAQENVSYTLNIVGVHGVAYTQNQVGEIHEDNIAPTLNTNSNASGRNVPILPDNLGLRRLTPRECERLQGFPDDWTKIPYRGKDLSICPDSPRYKACGNAVTVAVAEWVLKRLVNEVK